MRRPRQTIMRRVSSATLDESRSCWTLHLECGHDVPERVTTVHPPRPWLLCAPKKLAACKACYLDRT